MGFSYLEIVIVLIIIVIIIYYNLYRRYLNKRLSMKSYEKEVKGKKMPSVAEILPKLCIIVVVILGYVMLINKNEDMENEIYQLQQKINWNNIIISNLANDFENFQEDMKKQASPLNYLNILYGKYNKENHTCEIKFVASPKEIDEEESMSLYIEEFDKTINLEAMGNGTYEGKMTLDIFNIMPSEIQYNVDGEFSHNSYMVEPQYPEVEFDGEYIYYQYLAIFKSNIEDDSEIKDGKLKINISGEVYQINDYVEDDILVSAKITAMYGDGKSNPDNKVIDLKVAKEMQFNTDISVEYGDDSYVKLVFEGIDKYGFVYKQDVYEYSDGTYTVVMDDDIQIYDANGNLMNIFS